ncbi:hypothetical protein GCM10011369_04140 [Neiella marina]|uniref:Uncharacterized protein n=1 Tax=Neiella marina TaxID=508461 RepID=A0A8J2XL14_9GAMM|nr:hypothetical protein [Neiella marina]GGA65801.1 hypothetical protein GCM10011369_04140 [Neiella marina]
MIISASIVISALASQPVDVPVYTVNYLHQQQTIELPRYLRQAHQAIHYDVVMDVHQARLRVIESAEQLSKVG